MAQLSFAFYNDLSQSFTSWIDCTFETLKKVFNQSSLKHLDSSSASNMIKAILSSPEYNDNELKAKTAVAIEGMKKVLFDWSGTGHDCNLATAYMHFYDRKYPVLLLEIVLNDEVKYYFDALCYVRNHRIEPHCMGGESHDLMMRILDAYSDYSFVDNHDER